MITVTMVKYRKKILQGAELKNVWAFAIKLEYIVIHFQREKKHTKLYIRKLEDNEIKVDK